MHGIFEDKKEVTLRVKWNKTNKRLFFFLSITSAIVIFLLLVNNPSYLMYLFPAGIFTMYYTITRLDSKYNIFKKGYFKTLNLTFVWVYVTSLLPILAAERNLFSGDVLSFILMELVYVYLICFFFEHRDRWDDPQSYIFYNPHNQPKYILLFSSMLFVSAVFFAFINKVESAYIISKVFLFLLLVILAKKSLNTKSEWWFYFVLDGMMAVDIAVIALIWFLGLTGI